MAERFASKSDYALCRQIHKKFGTTYYFATLRFPERIRRRVHAIYAFVRVPDEWVDNPGTLTEQERLDLIESWRSQMVRGLEGERPEHFAMRAFVDTIRECNLPVAEAHLFLDAMAMDVWKTRYETYADLQEYMRGSASAVGVMMCFAMEANPDGATLMRAHALGEAMQMTNFLRDIGEDIERGRIYVPLEDLRQFGITEHEILQKRFTPAFREMMKFQVCRTKMLYCHSDLGLPMLPVRMRRAVMIARMLYAGILDVIVEQDYNVYLKRARTTRWTKLKCAFRVAFHGRELLSSMVRMPTQ